MSAHKKQQYMTGLHVLQPEQQAQWMDVLAQSFQYDVYHLPGYHALAEERDEGQAHLWLYTEGNYFVAIPLLLRSIGSVETRRVSARPGLRQRAGENPSGLAEPIGEGWLDATSVYGYPGPVASHSDVPASVVRNFQTALCETLKEWKIVTVFSRLHPLIPQCGLLSGLGECVPMGQTVSIDLSLSVEMQRQQYRTNHKRDINRARREGVTCVHDDDWKYFDTFIDIYYETMRRTGASDDYFFDRTYFIRLRELLGNHLHLFVALGPATEGSIGSASLGTPKEGLVLSGALFTVCDSIIQYHLGGTDSRYLYLGPSKLIFDTVRMWGAELGAEMLHLGGGVGSREDSLFRFKAGFSNLRCQFQVWKMVVNEQVYQQLLEQKRAWNQAAGLAAVDDNYFPAYRCPTQANLKEELR